MCFYLQQHTQAQNNYPFTLRKRTLFYFCNLLLKGDFMSKLKDTDYDFLKSILFSILFFILFFCIYFVSLFLSKHLIFLTEIFTYNFFLFLRICISCFLAAFLILIFSLKISNRTVQELSFKLTGIYIAITQLVFGLILIITNNDFSHKFIVNVFIGFTGAIMFQSAEELFKKFSSNHC